jgi:hypothetical protein
METIKQIKARHEAELKTAIDALYTRINIPGTKPWVAHDDDNVSLSILDYDAFHDWRTAQGIALTLRPHYINFHYEGIQFRAVSAGFLPNVEPRVKNINARIYANRYHTLTKADILSTYPTATNIQLHPQNNYTFTLEAN